MVVIELSNTRDSMVCPHWFLMKGHILRQVSCSHWFHSRINTNVFDIIFNAQIPWFEKPIIFDIRAKPRSIASLTGTKGS